MPSFDAIMIGGGTNGLACATRLAQNGARVLVLERALTVGGGAGTHEFAPGFRTSSLAHILNCLDPRVTDGMNLARHGIDYAATNLSTTALAADGNHLRLDGAFGARLQGDSPDAVPWVDLRRKLMTFASALAPFKGMTPPRLACGAGNERIGWPGWGCRCGRLAKPTSASCCG